MAYGREVEPGVIGEHGLKLVERPPAPHANEQGTAEGELAHLHGMADGLRGRWAQVSATAQVLEDSKIALIQANGGAKLKKKLKLNVGGTEFKGVKRETLCAVPESHLAELFSGRWEERLLRDSKGRIFLDVNPESFGKILTLLGDRKQRPGEPVGAPSSSSAAARTVSALTHVHVVFVYFAVVPGVPEELEPTLHRLLDFFGLGHLFAELEEEVPSVGAEPEAEPDGDEADTPPPQAAAAAVLPEAERVLVVADGESVDLPPRSIDTLIEAKYGIVDQEGKWIDVTEMVLDEIDEEGALSAHLSPRLTSPATHQQVACALRSVSLMRLSPGLLLLHKY